MTQFHNSNLTFNKSHLFASLRAMALILQIETATASCSVALARDGKTLAWRELNERNAHASSVTPFIDQVMKEAGLPLSALHAVAVSKGPGSYTGLRIGVSTAKGLCYALDIPLIAINTLTAMANSVREKQPGMFYCPMIDARRMEVYTAIYDEQLREVSPVEAKIIDAGSFADILTANKVLFLGDGAAKCEEVLSGQVNAVFLRGFVNSASHMNVLALEKFEAGAFEDVVYFEPYYLKDFIAGKPGQPAQ